MGRRFFRTKRWLTKRIESVKNEIELISGKLKHGEQELLDGILRVNNNKSLELTYSVFLTKRDILSKRVEDTTAE